MGAQRKWAPGSAMGNTGPRNVWRHSAQRRREHHARTIEARGSIKPIPEGGAEERLCERAREAVRGDREQGIGPDLYEQQRGRELPGPIAPC